MARYEFVEGTSSKFWDITLDGTSFTVRFGRIGTDGQVQVKTFATAAAAQTEHDKLVREKTKKGYAAVGDPVAAAAAPAAAAAAAPSPAPSPAPAPAPTPAPAPAAAPRAAKAPPPPPPVELAAQDGWIPCGTYAISVQDGKIVARNAKGRQLASVPKELKDTEPFQALADALALLDTHAAECREQVEGWMLRSLPVPAAVLAAVWPDEAWRRLLENAVVQGSQAGILRGVGPKGIGLVTLDGDTVWVADETVSIPHPILLAELDDYRSLLAETGLTQGLSQLFRETFPKPAEDADATTVDEWSDGEFELLAQAMNEAKKGGWRVRGGAACCAILEGGRTVEARYDLGEGDPMYETTTGSLYWVDGEGQTLARAGVGPVAWSEGMRMAATIYKKRKVEEKEDAE